MKYHIRNKTWPLWLLFFHLESGKNWRRTKVIIIIASESPDGERSLNSVQLQTLQNVCLHSLYFYTKQKSKICKLLLSLAGVASTQTQSVRRRECSDLGKESRWCKQTDFTLLKNLKGEKKEKKKTRHTLCRNAEAGETHVVSSRPSGWGLGWTEEVEGRATVEGGQAGRSCGPSFQVNSFYLCSFVMVKCKKYCCNN